MLKRQQSVFNLGSRYSYTPEEIAKDPAIASMIQDFLGRDSAYSDLGLTSEEVIRRVSKEGRIIVLHNGNDQSIAIMSQANRETALNMDKPPAGSLQHRVAKAGGVEVNIFTTLKPLPEQVEVWHKLKAEEAAARVQIAQEATQRAAEEVRLKAEQEAASDQAEATRAQVDQEKAQEVEEEIDPAIVKTSASVEASDSSIAIEGVSSSIGVEAVRPANPESVYKNGVDQDVSDSGDNIPEIAKDDPAPEQNPVSDLAEMLMPCSSEAQDAVNTIDVAGQALHPEDSPPAKSGYCLIL